ncbi:MAG: site-specific integrase [Bacteroidetes bacterium]|nr:site-specific integrase [Bacteroidota bacterium]
MYSLKEGQIDRLLKLVDNKRHKLVLLLMIDCGVGVSDCVCLKVSDFDFGKRILKIRNKVISVSDRCYDLLAGYISNIKDLKVDSFLFSGTAKEDLKNGNGHLCRKSVNKFLERLGRRHPEFCGVHPKALQMAGINSNPLKEYSFIKKAARNIKSILGFQKHKDSVVFNNEILRRAQNDKNCNKLKTFGRKKEIERIGKLLDKSVNVMVLGGVGVGKSHLIDKLVDGYEDKVLRLDDCYEIKRSLVSILMFLYRGDKDALKKELYPEFEDDSLVNHLQKDSMSNLCKEIIKVTKKNEYLLVIDSCDRITPRGVKILEELKDHFCILTAAREIPLNKSSFLWNFEIVRLKNLERRFALGLIYHLSDGMQIEDQWLFRNHVFEQSVGNPRVICELIERYRKEVVVTSDVVREVRHSGGLKEFDCSWFVIVFLGIISCLRFMSHELGNDSLRFIGGCSVLGLLIFRSLFSKRRKL